MGVDHHRSHHAHHRYIFVYSVVLVVCLYCCKKKSDSHVNTQTRQTGVGSDVVMVEDGRQKVQTDSANAYYVEQNYPNVNNYGKEVIGEENLYPEL